AVRADLGHKSPWIAVARPGWPGFLVGAAGGGKVGGIGVAGDVEAAERVHSCPLRNVVDAGGIKARVHTNVIGRTSGKVAGIAEHRIDNQLLAVVVAAELEMDPI